MSNSREIMERQNYGDEALVVCAAVTDHVLTRTIEITMRDSSCSVVALEHQQQSFTPPHKKSRRSKFKRSGK